MKKIVLILALFSLASCTNDYDTRRTLEDSGYTDIHVGGYSMWACGDDDTYATAFTAKNPAGKTVSGTVCCGMLTKGCTIRF